MKKFWKTEDRAIDSLLRARRGEQAGAQALCPEFDPDLAAAYLEHCLTPSEQASYERHISLCSSCRKSVVALARMAQAEAGSPIAASESLPKAGSAGWLAPLKGLFVGLARPQVAIAAIALVTLAVSMPILLSREGPVRQELALDRSPDAAPAQGAIQVTPADQGSNLQGEPTVSQASMENQRVRAQAQAGVAAGFAATRDESKQQPADDGKEKAGQEADVQAEQAAVAAVQKIEAQKSELKSESTPAAETGRQVAQERSKEDADAPKLAGPPASPEKRKELARIDPEEALRVKKDKNTVSVTELKPGQPGGDSKAKRDGAVAIRPEDAVAPAPEASSDESTRRGRIANNQPGRAFRRSESRPAPNRRTPERRAGSKKFYLLGDVWTDEDYRPEKEMPVVTLIRDSDLYKEVLTKHSGLKVYFNRFVEKERVIVVYKDTVYRIDPPQK